MKTSNRSFILDCRRHGPAVVSKRVCVLAIAALVAATVDLIAQSEFDFGDAPDPGYPTLLTNSGAYHAALNPTVILGTWIDGEPDGQPVPPGWGDDFNPPQQRDDEDGVRFPNALIAGVPSMVNVTVSGAGAQSWLQGWIDFDANFNWGDPGEQVILNSPVGNGSYAFPFPVGALTPAGRTYARFRVSTTPNLPFTGGASDGEVEDYEIQIDPLKWIQPPNLRPTGVDVDTDVELADDFQCTFSGPITDIHLWGSFLGDDQAVPLSVLTNMMFMLTIYSDIPDPNPADPSTWSTPGEPLWSYPFGPGQYKAGVRIPVPQGEWWHSPPGLWQPQADFNCYQFDFYPPPGGEFVQTKDVIYWLGVRVVSVPDGFRFGWKTTDLPSHFNDDAVWLDASMVPPKWMDLRYGDGHPYTELPYPENSMDLAFALSTPEEEIVFDWGDAPDGAAAPGYPTLSVNNGANHRMVPNIFLGAVIDAEGNGQPDPNALGDDKNPLGGPDDEDGVVFTSILSPGLGASVQVTASTGGMLNAWLDFNGDGSWSGEQIFSDRMLAAGVNNLTFTVPAGAMPGVTFARFRFSTLSGLSFTGGAPDGEVEDYEVRIEELDFGDAPDPTYPTLLANNGAHHAVGPMRLGLRVDSEPDGQPNANATGDDLNPPVGFDDEDGVVFPTALVAGMPNTIQVRTSVGGILQAWLDLNADGDWADPGEQVIVNRTLLPLINNVTFNVPASLSTSSGRTFMRFRLSSIQGLGYTGPAPDGEVEDYEIKLQSIKWLQRPETGHEGVDVDNANTPLADDFLCTKTGPITDIHLWGSFVRDVLPAGGPTNMTFALTIWSDVPAGVDPPYSHPGAPLWTGTFAPGTFDAGLCIKTSDGEWWHNPATGLWQFPGDTNIYQFDFYLDPGEAFFQQEGKIYWLEVQYQNQGGQDFTFGWKTSYDDWNDAACWLNPGGPVQWSPLYYGDGHPRTQTEATNLNFAFALSTSDVDLIDWGDAPDPTYPTLAANGGASHVIVPGLFLGQLIDAERDGQPNATATGDDTMNLADEDGVAFAPPVFVGQTSVVVVVASAPGILNGWLDCGGDGSWAQAGDHIFTNVVLAAGVNNLSLSVPASAVPGLTFARMRFSTLSGLSYTGPAPDGEVEDYAVPIEELTPDLGDAPDSSNNSGANMTAYPIGGPPGVVAQYPTVYAGGVAPAGPRHWLPRGIAHLGPAVTGELEADIGPDQDPTNNILPPIDKPDLDGADDGLRLPLALPHCRLTSLGLTVNVVNPTAFVMYLNVWADWNRDGDWNDIMNCPGGATVPEWAVQNQPVNVGTAGLMNLTTAQFLSWHPTLNPASLWMRVTLSERTWPPVAGAAPVGGEGPAAGYQYGETEDYYITDYEVEEVFDFGDAPDPTYPTLRPLGAQHYIVPGFHLGRFIDSEVNGLPNLPATGDDTNNLADEDGITFTTPIVRGSNACVDVLLTSGPAGGFLDGWVDFNKNGVWDHPSERVFNARPLAPGVNLNQCLLVPNSAKLGSNYFRFRLSSVGGLPPGGTALDGEVEDYLVRICQRKPAAKVAITNIVVTNIASQQVITLQWNAETAIAYQVQETVTLSNAPAPWSNLGPEITGPANTLVTTNAPMFERYYRVKVPDVCP